MTTTAAVLTAWLPALALLGLARWDRNRQAYRPAHDNGETWERRNRRKLAG